MKKITLITILLIAAVQLSFSQQNYKRVTINTINESTIHQLQDIGVDLTCGTILKNNQITLELFDHELDQLKSQGIPYTILIENMQKFYSERAKSDAPKALQELEYERSLSAQKSFSVNEILNNVGQYNECNEIDWAVPANWNLNPNLGTAGDDFGGCLTYDMVLQELDDMRAAYPNLISAKLDTSVTPSDTSVETTVEGRTVYYVRISDNPDIDEAGEPETLYQSLIHSREAATVMNQLYFMWYILENYSTDTAIQNLVNNQALYFVPVFNPDGFVYNQTQAPNGGGGQRKNRNTSGGCGTYDDGIDLNRNSGYYWGNGGSSTTNNCSAIYAGSAPFSEIETQIMRDFFLDHDFELALNHHSFKNAMLHAYAGVGHIANPRPDEYSKYNHDMTYYNRYAHGPSTSISGLNSGNMNDWMLGGPNGTNPSNGVPSGGTGSGKETLAWTPENGLSSEGTGGSYGGFWPAPSNYLPIAKRAMRMNFMAAYFSGKYGKVHDLNQNDITATSGDLSFAIENLGQQASDFTVTVTAVSNINIPGATNFAMESFTAAEVLDQRTVNIPYTLPGGIQPNDKIEFKVVLTNNYATDNVLYEANIVKAYTPNVIFAENADPASLTNWTSSGSWTTTNDAYSGSSAIKSNSTAIYAANQNRTLQLNGSLDLTNMSAVLLQYHAKWDLERSYDYVTIEGSTNGSSWTELCGKLTKPGAPTANNSYSSTSDAGDSTFKSSTDDQNQNNITSLYDGDTQDKWNMEEVVIDASSNSFLYNQGTVFLRFRLDTDSSNRKDSYANADFEGFTFDNFKVIEVSIACDDSIPPTGVTANNITATTVDISWDNIPSATYDLRYRETGTTPWTTITDIAGVTQSLTGLDINTEYEVQVATRCVTTTSSFSASTIFTTLDPCANTIDTFPYTQTFENNTIFNNEWTQGTNTVDDDIDWTRDNGTTPSSGTGPTGGAGGSTWFVYTEASVTNPPEGSPRKTAIMTSNCVDFTGRQNAEISFDYHMFGADLGSSAENPATNGYIALEVSNDYGANYTTISIINDDSQDLWKSASNIDLSAYDGDIVLIRFRGVTGTSWSSDMALDNINIDSDLGSSAPPTAVCQNITVQLDATGNATIVATDVDGGSTDDISITNYSIDINTFDCSDIGNPVDVTLTVTDGDSQTDTCVATVTVEDTIDPILTLPANTTVECDASTAPANTGTATATDNCDASPTVTFLDATVGNVITRTWTATDATGNSDSADQTITLQDTTDPVVSVPANTTVECDASTAPANTGTATATDNCDASPTVTFSDATVGNVITRTWTATDANGNSDSADQTITLQDTTDPVVSAPANTTVECDASTAPANTGTATATDNCDASPTVTFSDATVGNVITRTWTATDANGNSDSADQTITLQDTTDPVVSVPANTTVECDASTAPANTGTATATDNCDASPTVTFSDATVGNVITRTWTATDANGNSDSADQTITLQDTTDPVVSAPANTTVECDASTAPANTGTATATDNCDASPTVTFSDATVGNVITRTWTATDANGNSDSADQTITLQDTTDPVVSVPANTTVECDASTAPANTGTATATDNCDASPTVTFLDATVGNVITRTWTATDATGNSDSADQTITLQDTTDPVVSVPANTTVECDASTAPANTGTATATDNCDASPTVTISDATVGNVITRTWTATDANGNSDSADQTITLQDTTDPVVSVPANTTVECDASTAPANTGTATATDNCDASPTVTFLDATVGNVITRTWTATDATGNSDSADQTITLQDTTDPVVSVPANTTVECDASTAPANTGTATATDNCDASPTVTISDATVGNVITRTWTATDANGNSDSADQTITLQDTTDPVVSAPANTTVECDASTAPANTGTATATDNCDASPTVTFSDATVGNVITRTWTATDANGNSDSADQTITLQDTTDPVVSVPANTTVECDASTAPANTGTATATDNCDASPTVTFSDATVGNVITRTWTATDANGNSDSADQTITLQDTTDPVPVCQNITIQLDGTGNASIVAADVDGGSSDNCGIASISIDISSFDTGDIGDNNVTLTVTDNNGNTESCIAIVTVEEDTLTLPNFNSNTVRIAPNPFASFIDIHLPLNFNNSDFTINIYDLNGRIVYNSKMSSSNGLIKVNGLENLEEAPYFIKVTRIKSGQSIYKKLIKHE